MKVYIIALTVLFALLAVTEAKKGKSNNAPQKVPCPCVPKKGDCGRGFREGACQDKKIKCKVPCGWKEEFGADCKYTFSSWTECDATSGSQTKTGRLRKALHGAVCQETVSTSRPCKPQTKPPKETGSKPPKETGSKPPKETGSKPPKETGSKPVPETEPKPAPEIQPKPVPEIQPKPDETKGTALSEADKAYIVNRHNQLRRGVKPTASNMLKMSWSDEAAANAQKWADASQCVLGHSKSADRIISTSGCGENVAMGHAHTESSWHKSIQMWYDEVKDFKYGEGSVNGETIGHYTQVVWYRSNLIGCAVAHCPDAHYKYIYVCQYCQPGNYQYTHPYQEGEACGACPNDCDQGLCTNPCPYKDKWNNCADGTAWKCANTDACEATCKCTSGEIL